MGAKPSPARAWHERGCAVLAMAAGGRPWEPPGVTTARRVDPTAGWLGVASLVTLLASEVALTLPDVDATASAVATFYAAHRAFIVVLQIIGFAASATLGVFAWRLGTVRRGAAVAGLVMAATTAVPGLITLVLALTADPQRPNAAGHLNQFEPRGDDLLFAGVTIFAATVAVLLWRAPPWLGALAMAVALCCLARLTSEALGRGRGMLDSLAPLSFLLLIAALSWLAFRGYPVRRTAT
jgi:hypothetical protein